MKTVKRTSAIILALVLIASVFTACSLPFGSPEKKLLGAWSDSAGVIGFEFKEGNIVSVGANIIPGISTPTLDATYTVSKNENKQNIVTISYTLIVTMSLSYVFEVNGDTLTLTNVDGGSPTIYTRATASNTSSAS